MSSSTNVVDGDVAVLSSENHTYRRSSRWAVDMGGQSSSSKAFVDPPFYRSCTSEAIEAHASHGAKQAAATATLKLKKAWDIALGPGKQLPLNAFMMYMAGSGVNIFSIMITGMMFFNPTKALLSVNTTFASFDKDKDMGSVLLPKVVFVLLNMVAMCLGLYKCSSLGFLPTSPSDWLDLHLHKESAEISGGGLLL